MSCGPQTKDNEPTISNSEFVEAVFAAVEDVFDSENILRPAIRVSHSVKGRIPDAKHKSAKELLDAEKTVYYESVMFTIEVPTIFRDINGNHLSLTVGGVRGYHQENLYARRNMPSNERKGYPEMLFTEHQLNLMVDGYYNDSNFGRRFDGSIDMWRLYNLFTSANKQSYIDKFLDRGLNASMVVDNISSYLV